MTEREWAGIAHTLENGFPGDFDRDADASYRLILNPFPAVTVEKALTALARRGGTWRPSASDIAGLCQQELVPGLAWDDAQSMIYAAFRRNYHPAGLPEKAVVADLVAVEPSGIVALFVARYGARRLQAERVDDPDYGPLVRGRLEEAWKAHVQRCSDRVAAGQALDPAGEAVARLESGTGLRQITFRQPRHELGPGTPACPVDELSVEHRAALDVIWAPIVRKLRTTDEEAHDRYATRLHLHGVSDTGLVVGADPDLDGQVRDQLALVLAALADRSVTVTACHGIRVPA